MNSKSRTHRKPKTEAENNGFTVPGQENRTKLAKTLTGLPGQIEGNPLNVTSTMVQQYGPNKTPYGDFQVTTPATTPVQAAARSQIPENKPIGVKNNRYAYGTIPQPPSEYMSHMTGMAASADAAKRGLNVKVQPSQFNQGQQMSGMGMIGSAAPMTGSIPLQMPMQSSNSIPLNAGTPDVAKTATAMDAQPKKSGLNTKTGQRRSQAA
tara:strand:+ start:1394 stop:2020 length:627 start_codon:yes stop_codon:yes gene_type:complete